MTEAMSTAELEAAKQAIYAVDLSSVINRLVNIEKWKKQDAEAGTQQYRNYLFLRKKYPDLNLPPSKDIDEVWHAHILHTEEYRDFCKKAFYDQPDHYLDHHPHLAKEGSMNRLKQLFEKTQDLYREEFGEYIYQITGRSWFKRGLGRVADFVEARYPKLVGELKETST